MSTSNSYGATSTSGSGLKANLSRRPGGAGSESGVQRTNSEQQKPPAVSKVEPKVFLASERTFFSWIRVSLLLGSFGLALFNSGDGLGRAMGLTYAGISLLAVRPSCCGAAVDGIGLIQLTSHLSVLHVPSFDDTARIRLRYAHPPLSSDTKHICWSLRYVFVIVCLHSEHTDMRRLLCNRRAVRSNNHLHTPVCSRPCQLHHPSQASQRKDEDSKKPLACGILESLRHYRSVFNNASGSALLSRCSTFPQAWHACCTIG